MNCKQLFKKSVLCMTLCLCNCSLCSAVGIKFGAEANNALQGQMAQFQEQMNGVQGQLGQMMNGVKDIQGQMGQMMQGMTFNPMSGTAGGPKAGAKTNTPGKQGGTQKTTTNDEEEVPEDYFDDDDQNEDECDDDIECDVE